VVILVEADFNPNKVIVRKNTGPNIGARHRLNFIEGNGITLTIADSPANNEVQITIAGGGGKCLLMESHIPFIALGVEQSI